MAVNDITAKGSLGDAALFAVESARPNTNPRESLRIEEYPLLSTGIKAETDSFFSLNVSKMICFHSKYSVILSDKNIKNPSFLKFMEIDKFEDFFDNYSRNVDKAENVGFWKLSDKIILEIIKKHLNPQENSTILDAGGGTGR